MGVLSSLCRGPSAVVAFALAIPAIAAVDVDLNWYPPKSTDLNNLTRVLSGEGVYGFIYNSSETPDSMYGTYNWCNMPHVRRQEYVKAPEGFELKFVEVSHRHHKRTPYADNTFPVESYGWECSDVALFYTGEPIVSKGPYSAAKGYLDHFKAAENHFTVNRRGFAGNCQFPQLTAGALDDSYVHGADLYGVYHDLLGFLPDRSDGDWQSRVQYRVTNNPITSQVAGMVISGMWRTADRVSLLVGPDGIDSLEPQSFCPAGQDAFSRIQSGSNPEWAEHQERAADVYAALDDISGVPADDGGFHKSFDHYYDNLSARQCHAKPLPCKLVDGKNDTSNCVPQELADTVYRLGHWEYSELYRGAESLAAAASTYGTWISTLANHLRGVVEGTSDGVIYFHNVAHDGSISRLLSVLQIDTMVWPGMGSEVVFELYEKKSKAATTAKPARRPCGGSRSGFYVRVMFGGRVLRSSNPSLGVMDMIPVETLLAYLDGLAGRDASKVVGLCNGTIPLGN